MSDNNERDTGGVAFPHASAGEARRRRGRPLIGATPQRTAAPDRGAGAGPEVLPPRGRPSADSLPLAPASRSAAGSLPLATSSSSAAVLTMPFVETVDEVLEMAPSVRAVYHIGNLALDRFDAYYNRDRGDDGKAGLNKFADELREMAERGQVFLLSEPEPGGKRTRYIVKRRAGR